MLCALFYCFTPIAGAEDAESTNGVKNSIEEGSSGLIILKEAEVEEPEPERVFRPDDSNSFISDEIAESPEMQDEANPPETGSEEQIDENQSGSESEYLLDDGLPRVGYLIDQDGNRITFEQYKGKIVLLSFIYLECRHGHCPLLTKRMNFIGRKFPDRLGADIQLVTVSFDPDVDTVTMLKEYSALWESDPSRWAFLTGKKGDIADIAAKYGIIFIWNEKEQAYDHSVRTFLLDRSGEVVRIYKGMNYNLWEVINDIKILLTGKKLEIQTEKESGRQSRP